MNYFLLNLSLSHSIRCDNDTDGDSISDELDNCPLLSNVDQADVDGDGVGDVCDDSSHWPNPVSGMCSHNSINRLLFLKGPMSIISSD